MSDETPKDTGEPKAAEPKAAEPKAAEPKAAEPKAADPKPAKPAGAAPAAERPKKAAPPPDPRVEAAKAKAEQVRAAIVEKLGEDAVEETGAAHVHPMVRIRPQDWLRAAEVLKSHPEWKLNYLECMVGTDYPDYIEVVVYIQSTELSHFVCLKTRTDRDQAELPSLVSAYPGVNWEEREIFDLLGVHFTGHPDLRRIMMWDDFKGHPLRKDYSEWD